MPKIRNIDPVGVPPAATRGPNVAGAERGPARTVPCAGCRFDVGRRSALAQLGLGVSLAYATPILLTLSRAGAGEHASGAAAPDPAGDEIGSATKLVRTVTGEMRGEVYRLLEKDDVHREEVIETAVSSASEIVFLDDTKISLGPNTRLTLDEFVFDPDPKRGKFVLTTVKGVFRFVSGNLAKQSYVIRTPTLTIGVRGTVFTSVTRDDGTTVVVLQCPACEFRWQPKKRRHCLRENTSEITVTSLTGVAAMLDQCGLAVTVLPDGSMTPPGPPPDWAISPIEELDELVGDPDDTGDTRDTRDTGDTGDTGDDGDDGGGTTTPGGGTTGGGGGGGGGYGDNDNPGRGDNESHSTGNEGRENPGKGKGNR